MTTHPDPVTLVANPGSGAVQFVTRQVDGGGGSLRLTLGYRRSADFDARNDPGQDHAVVRAGGGRAVGVVADGVSQSFFGDIAATSLVQGLADYLWNHAADPPVAEAFARELGRLRGASRRKVERHPIPADVPELARTGLERLRGSAGSQAVFAAFVLNARGNVAHIYTVGDAGVVLHGGSADAPGTDASGAPAGRWSTHGAPPLGLRASRYAGVRAVVVRSDGARGWGDVLPGPGAEEAFHEQAPRLAGYDDVAFVIAQIEGSAPAVPLTLESSTDVDQLPGAVPEPVTPYADPGAAVLLDAATSPVAPARRPPPFRAAPVAEAHGALRRRPERLRRAGTAALIVVALTAGAGARLLWFGKADAPPVAKREAPAARPAAARTPTAAHRPAASPPHAVTPPQAVVPGFAAPAPAPGDTGQSLHAGPPLPRVGGEEPEETEDAGRSNRFPSLPAHPGRPVTESPHAAPPTTAPLPHVRPEQRRRPRPEQRDRRATAHAAAAQAGAPAPPAAEEQAPATVRPVPQRPPAATTAEPVVPPPARTRTVDPPRQEPPGGR